MARVQSLRGTNYLSSYILQRIERNKNFIGGITGQTGSGKTYSALRLAETIDPDFNIRNVCFSAREFMNLVSGKTKTLKRGSVIVYDELQVSMGAMDYQNLTSKLINYCLSTFRHQGFVLFCTMPYFSMVNATARKLFHCRAETISINVRNKYVTIKPLMLQVSQASGEIYQKYLRVLDKTTGTIVPLTRLRVSMPSPELVKAYEERKTEFTKSLNEDIIKQLDDIEGKGKKELTYKQQEVIDLLKEGQTPEVISQTLGVTITAIYKHIELIRKKGIEINAKKDGLRVIGYEVLGI